MDIQKAQFPRELLNIIQHVTACHFIAFDLEFSGVAGRRRVPPGTKRDKLTMQEMYDDVKEAAEKYQILQVGLTIVEEDHDKGRYILRPYNFNIDPVPSLKERHLGRVWSYHSSAVSFLRDNGFRFDLPITHGIAYLSRKEDGEARETMATIDAENAALPDMPLKDADIPLLTHIREVITKWQSKPKNEQEEYLNIPLEANYPAVPQVLDRYQIRLTHQTVRNEFPGLKTHGMGHFVQITNPTDLQLESQQAILERQREREISEAIGFRWLMEAIMGGDISKLPREYFDTGDADDEKSNKDFRALRATLPHLQAKLRARRKIFVGHNCFTDLVNLYKCFIGNLPDKLEDFQRNVHALFPGVIDTKHVASFGGKPYGDTSLGHVYDYTNVEQYPNIELAAGFERYEFVESYHEAGYDSMQTAKVLIKLSALIERDNKLKDKKIESDTTERGFGEGEGYVTATESQSDGGMEPASFTKKIINVTSSPVTAMKNLLLSDSSLYPEPKSTRLFSNQTEAKTLISGTDDLADSPSSVVAVRKTQLSNNSSATTEVERVKSKFSSASVFDVLNAEKGDSDDDTRSDLLLWSDDEDRKKQRKEKKRLKRIARQDKVNKMVEKGELMPRWDGGKGFWLFFGNKLQVNGTVENVCCLP